MNSDEQERELSSGQKDDRRRDALRKIALFGAYTAPVMLGLLTSTKALAVSGGGGGCCAVDAFISTGSRVGDARIGDPLLMMEDNGEGTFKGSVQVSRPLQQPCLRIQTAAGIVLTCSYSTPMPVRREGDIHFIQARDCLEGDVVPVEDEGGFRWEPLKMITEAGRLRVQLITANDGIYGAGDEAGRLIFTHNKSVA